MKHVSTYELCIVWIVHTYIALDIPKFCLAHPLLFLNLGFTKTLNIQLTITLKSHGRSSFSPASMLYVVAVFMRERLRI